MIVEEQMTVEEFLAKHADDELISINGKPISEMTLEAIEKLIGYVTIMIRAKDGIVRVVGLLVEVMTNN